MAKADPGMGQSRDNDLSACGGTARERPRRCRTTPADEADNRAPPEARAEGRDPCWHQVQKSLQNSPGG